MISNYELEMLTPPCDPGSVRLVAKAHLAVDIAAVLPYLNATLPDASYLPEAKSLTWKDNGHAIALHPYEIAVGDVDDRDDGAHVIDDLVNLINRTWQRRGEIVPSVATRRRPTPMAVFKLLPGTNCKECDLSGCWQFALKLITGEARTGECPELAQPSSDSRLAELRILVGETA
jgi:ArsR family metal-binding transcriptional regulator